MTTSISLRDPGDLVVTLPYQLGYHPRRSVVVVALHGRRTGLVARLDLPPAGVDPSAVVTPLAAPFRREPPDAVVVVGFEDEPDEAVPLLAAVVDDLSAVVPEVVDVLVVRDGRRYSLTCREPCCPPGGVPLPPPDRVPGIAELVAQGSAPLRGREDVDRAVAADGSLPPPPVRRGSRAAPRDRRRAAVAAWAAVLGAEPGTPPRERPSRVLVARVATAAAGLADVPLRDALIAWLVPGLLPADDLDPDVLRLLERRMPRWGGMGGRTGTAGTGGPGGPGSGEEVDPGERRVLLDALVTACRAVPDDRAVDAAAMCTVLAHVAWYGGDGALARAALDRALRLVPDYRLATLLDRLVTHGIRPSTIPAPEARRAG